MNATFSDLKACEDDNQKLAEELDQLDNSRLKSFCLVLFKTLAMIAIILFLIIFSSVIVKMINASKNQSPGNGAGHGRGPHGNVNQGNMNLEELDHLNQQMSVLETEIDEELVTEIEMAEMEFDFLEEMEPNQAVGNKKHGQNNKPKQQTTLKIATDEEESLGSSGGIGGTFKTRREKSRPKFSQEKSIT